MLVWIPKGPSALQICPAYRLDRPGTNVELSGDLAIGEAARVLGAEHLESELHYAPPLPVAQGPSQGQQPSLFDGGALCLTIHSGCYGGLLCHTFVAAVYHLSVAQYFFLLLVR